LLLDCIVILAILCAVALTALGSRCKYQDPGPPCSPGDKDRSLRRRVQSMSDEEIVDELRRLEEGGTRGKPIG
jgi:hypothetical protein